MKNKKMKDKVPITTIIEQLSSFTNSMKNRRFTTKSKMKDLNLPHHQMADLDSLAADETLYIFAKNVGSKKKLDFNNIFENNYISCLQELSNKSRKAISRVVQFSSNYLLFNAGRCCIVINTKLISSKIEKLNEITNQFTNSKSKTRCVDLELKIFDYVIKVVNSYYDTVFCDQKLTQLKETTKNLEHYKGNIIFAADLNFNTTTIANNDEDNYQYRYSKVLKKFVDDHKLIPITGICKNVLATNFGASTAIPDVLYVSEGLVKLLNFAEVMFDGHSSHAYQRFGISNNTSNIKLIDYSSNVQNSKLLYDRNMVSGKKIQSEKLMKHYKKKIRKADGLVKKQLEAKLDIATQNYEKASAKKDDLTNQLKTEDLSLKYEMNGSAKQELSRNLEYDNITMFGFDHKKLEEIKVDSVDDTASYTTLLDPKGRKRAKMVEDEDDDEDIEIIHTPRSKKRRKNNLLLDDDDSDGESDDEDSGYKPLPFCIVNYITKRTSQEVNMIGSTRFANVLKDLENVDPTAKTYKLTTQRLYWLLHKLKLSDNIDFDEDNYEFTFKDEFIKKKMVKNFENEIIGELGDCVYISVDIALAYNKFGSNYSKISSSLNSKYKTNIFKADYIFKHLKVLIRKEMLVPRDQSLNQNEVLMNDAEVMFSRSFIEDSIINIGDTNDDYKKILDLHTMESQKSIIFPVYLDSMNYKLEEVLPTRANLGEGNQSSSDEQYQLHKSIVSYANAQILNGAEPDSYKWEDYMAPFDLSVSKLRHIWGRLKHIYYKFNGLCFVELSRTEIKDSYDAKVHDTSGTLRWNESDELVLLKVAKEFTLDDGQADLELIQQIFFPKRKLEFLQGKLDESVNESVNGESMRLTWDRSEEVILYNATLELTLRYGFPDFQLVKNTYFPERSIDSLRQKYTSFFETPGDIGEDEGAVIFETMILFTANENNVNFVKNQTIYSFIQKKLQDKFGKLRKVQTIKCWWEEFGQPNFVSDK
ncbi:hypothetical protein KGF54_000386 [Candida jiufengensis]|uniref:uncharacterized protein n=1 Tax=Candida jiufengensis TaxID=497108 RepID=UPI0022259B70|nr:uncharacterized protein KGF54_000386 [Candida jiufengensis]KAI5956769.1 hypothetical protein KGF54_000386 [Candida jiufengensis]